MHRTIIHRLIILCTCALAATGFGESLKVGVATTEITPPVGWRMSGYFYERFSTNTHDPLEAKAMVLQQGNEKAALVICDLIGISGELSTRVRQAASRKTRIPSANIMIAATHTHTGPLYMGGLREYFHSRAQRQTGSDPAERVDYQGILEARLVDLIAEAQRSMQPAYLEVASTKITNLSFNRRYVMKDGKVQTNPGKTNQNIARVAGPIDPELGFIAIMNGKRDEIRATFTSFAMHPDTIGGTEYSADYPLYLEQSLRKLLVSDLVSLFGNGPCGNINHVDVFQAKPQKGQEEAERIGKAMSEAIGELLPKLRPIKKPALRVGRETVVVPLQKFKAEAIVQAKADMAKIGGHEMTFLDQVNTARIYDLQFRGSSALELEVQGIALGSDTAIVTVPGELFCELGMAIKKGSPFTHTYIVELCNDSIGYVPTRKAYAEGGYEPANSRLAPGGGEMLVEAAIKLLKKL
ncbi:MAG TPA: neutral/alkaline non-lysosomal ceramidase N-terminal domain-containing protein [Candidatus Saccharimonadales bacterium]|nr:neutral/alkaline non-lysosomal ceramidase N-terminal domain-containing protein [Candidatus Saccharimonadales bacterium]